MRPPRAPLAALCATLALLAAGASPAQAAVHALKGTITGERIALGDQFKDACGVTTDNAGDVYVADHYGNRVAVFGPKGEYLTTIDDLNPLDAGGVAPIDGPCDLAADSKGRLYVNDYHRDVVRFTPSSFPPQQGTDYGTGAVIDSSHPTGVDVDLATDDVYVDDHAYVAVYEPSGAPVLDGGEPLRIGSASLEGQGYGVAVSGFAGTQGRVYVANAAAAVVEVFDPLGDPAHPVEVINGGGNPDAGFTSLVDSDLAVDPLDGHLYVADNVQPGFERPEGAVYEFSPQGHYRDQVPHPKAEGEHPKLIIDAEPSGVATHEGNIYVTSGNGENSLVLIFSPGDASPTYVLSAAKTGSGSGALVSSPGGLNCGDACDGEFDAGAKVTLFATLDRGSRLVGWSGCESNPTANTCAVTMSADHLVTAEFGPAPQRTLTVLRGGAAAGTIVSSPSGIECGGSCEDEFDEGSLVTLTATADLGSRFSGWSGCDSEPSPSSCQVTMSAARSVGAEFEAEPEAPRPPSAEPGLRTLSVSSTGLGTAAGTVTSAPGGIDCGSVCSHAYQRGASILLVAHPAVGSAFLGWGGCESASGVQCTLTLGSDRNVVAAFGPAPPGPLRIDKVAVRGATATLTVPVPGPGTLIGSGKYLRPAQVLPLAAGRITLRLRLAAAGRRALARSARGRLATKAALTFAPLEGGPTVRTSRALSFGGRAR